MDESTGKASYVIISTNYEDLHENLLILQSGNFIGSVNENMDDSNRLEVTYHSEVVPDDIIAQIEVEIDVDDASRGVSSGTKDVVDLLEANNFHVEYDCKLK